MNVHQKVRLISLAVLLLCLVVALIIYLYTGQIFIIILIAPAIIYWILEKKLNNK